VNEHRHLTNTSAPPHNQTSIYNIMANNTAMEKALDALKSQEKPNFKKTAEEFGINRTTLMMRFKGQRTSREEAVSTHLKLLTNTQESELLLHIDQLTLRGLPPTPQMLRNFVTEITNQPVGEAWVRRFRQRYANQIDSKYLRAIDQTRKVADNSKHFKHYYEVVRAHAPYFL
jgi:hypothetical protein